MPSWSDCKISFQRNVVFVVSHTNSVFLKYIRTEFDHLELSDVDIFVNLNFSYIESIAKTTANPMDILNSLEEANL